MTKLTLKVEGERGQVLLQDVLGRFKSSLAILRELDSALSGRPRGALDWYVEDLSANGKLVAEIFSTPKTGKYEDIGPEVTHQFIRGLGVVEQEPGVPPFFSESAVANVERLAAGLGKRGAMGFGAQSTPQESVRITHQAALNAGQAIKPRFKAIGSIAGTLEAISLHNRDRFNVYEAVTGTAVRCYFERDKYLEIVRNALGHRVRAYGVIARNARGDALRLDMRDLEILPEDSKLPTIRDIFGIAPDFTEEMTSCEYVRWLREA